MKTPPARIPFELLLCIGVSYGCLASGFLAGCMSEHYTPHPSAAAGTVGGTAGATAGVSAAGGTSGAAGTTAAGTSGEAAGTSGAAVTGAAGRGIAGTSAAGTTDGGAAGTTDGGAAGTGAGTAGTSAGGTAAGGSTGGTQGTVPNALETLSVPGAGTTVMSRTSLDNGELFLLKATGTVVTGATSVDAEFGGISAAGAGQDMVSGTDVGVDVGIKFERAPMGRKKWFGAYRADHTYYVIVTGAGAPLSIKLLLPAGVTGTGALALSIIRLSPMATALAPALETVLANYTKPTVRSVMTTSTSVVYLLQCTGQGKVGGGNLAMGDADWMDYAADGTGKVDIGDGNVDYGLGVDESMVTVTPRARWWGPFRRDHSYFMLYAGTGTTIGFSYYDVGDYGDNTKTDKLTVKVFPVP